MDIAGALTLVGQATSIAKSLKEIDRSLDAAAYKARIAELTEHLVDLKLTLSDAREELHTKDRTIRELQTVIEALKSGDVCPICEQGRLKVKASTAHKQFGRFLVFTRENAGLRS